MNNKFNVGDFVKIKKFEELVYYMDRDFLPYCDYKNLIGVVKEVNFLDIPKAMYKDHPNFKPMPIYNVQFTIELTSIQNHELLVHSIHEISLKSSS
jgi:hypothetical protein